MGTAALILLGGCNQMDTVLLSTGSYQVDALVGQFSLHEYSVIAAGDVILPYFVNSVRNDPDLNSLVLYVEDDDQKVLGRRVVYTTVGRPQREKDGEDRVLEGDAGEINRIGKGELAETGGGPEETGYGGETIKNFVPFEVEETTIKAADFTGKLPPFPLPEDLEIGAYSLVFEIRGDYGVLSRARQPFYYIGDQQFTVGEIRHYLPEFSENRYLVSQGLTVMLETPLEYGGALDPYIIWYNGKNKIGEGFASAGTARVLWAAPLRSGFHAIRAELFPFGPQAGLQGKIKEFSLPVSPKNERKTAAGTESGGYLYRYLFAGDLLDAETGAGLDPVQISGLPLAWYPAEQVYGLGLREGDIYETPGYSLDLSGEELGELTLFIRALALEDGGIFTASLGSALKIGLSLNEEVLVLDLEGQGQTSRISAAARKSGWDPAFTGVLVTVKFERTRVSACMVPADSPAGAVLQESEASEDAVQAAQEEAPLSGRAEIALTGPVTGKLRSRIGREASKAPVMEAMETAVWAPDTVSTPPSSDYFSEPSPASALPVLVVDDFTAVFRRYRREVEIIEKEEALEGAEMGERAEIPENPEKVENTAGADKIEKTVDGAAEEEAADSGDSEPDGLSFSGLPG